MEQEKIKEGVLPHDSEWNDSDKVFDQLNKDFEAVIAKDILTVTEAVQNGKPLLGFFTQGTPEIFAALDLPRWFAATMQLMALRSEEAPKIIDFSAQLGLTTFMCSYVKAGVFLLQTGSFPTPTMLIGATEPCDGNVALWQMASEYRPWANIPKFLIDIPYGMDKLDIDDARVRYLAEQIKASTSFMEEHCGRKMDIDHLKQVCDESNRARQLWWEFQELRRAVPTPVSFLWGQPVYALNQVLACGKPETTEWMQRLVDATEKRVKERKGIGGVTDKIRLLWYDLTPSWGHKLFPQLEKDFGAVVSMEMLGWMPPLTPIDTSTEEAIYESLAKRYSIGPPMLRQGMASLDTYCNDLVHIVNDFKIDAVILPGHVGHKNTNAVVKICSDVCRETGVPSLFLGCDVYDERYMTANEVYEKIGRFLSATNFA
jgi:benzoyl-CoA reductase/2-hydroxyglutaryl-CoA dehydratase subunit BcrC/BadD/HgdB